MLNRKHQSSVSMIMIFFLVHLQSPKNTFYSTLFFTLSLRGFFLLKLTFYFPFPHFISMQWRLLSHMLYLPADSPSARGFQQQHRNSSTYPSCDFKALHLCKYRSHAFIPNFLQCHYPDRQPFMTAALSVKQVRLECCQKPLEQSFSFHLNSDKCISVPKRKKKYSSKTLQKFLIIFFPLLHIPLKAILSVARICLNSSYIRKPSF